MPFQLLEEIKVAVQKLDNPEFPDGQPSHVTNLSF